jgi:hypothetical protein
MKNGRHAWHLMPKGDIKVIGFINYGRRSGQTTMVRSLIYHMGLKVQTGDAMSGSVGGDGVVAYICKSKGLVFLDCTAAPCQVGLGFRLSHSAMNTSPQGPMTADMLSTLLLS